MQKSKLKTNIFEVEKFICLGTPFDYENYMFWQKYFKKNIDFKTLTKTKNNNLIPMSGRGKRFRDYGYRVPKPLIQINKMPMLKFVTDTFPKSENWNFIIDQNDNKNNRIEKLINKISSKSKIIKVKKTTEGPASSCNLAKKNINQNEPLFISSCDYLTIFNEKKLNKLIKRKEIDGIIWTSKLNNQIIKSYNAFGYCKVNKKKYITKIVEKNTISNDPGNDDMMIGSFWFKKASYFFENYAEAKRKKLTINDEYYVGNNINLLLKNKYKFVIFEIDQWISLGDPFELKMFEYWKNLFEI
jgi:NDP-sugar pyrophosphorylase family protein